MTTNANLTLSDPEVDAVRRLGGAAYMGVIFVQGVRGGRYAPLRTQVWRTEELAQDELDSIRLKPACRVVRREVVVIDAQKRQVI